MRYSRETYETVNEQFKRQKESLKNECEMRRRLVFEKIPRIREITQELYRIKVQAVNAMFSDKDITVFKEKSLSLQQERKQLLKSNGYSEDYIDHKYICEKCQDEGYILTEMCECYENKLKAEQFKRSKLGGVLGNQTFDNFKDDIFKDPKQRKSMIGIKKSCQKYADEFSTESRNLFFIGTPGTGKTFLSSCIANEVASKGFSVTYETAINITAKMDNVKFGRAEPDTVKEYTENDLLIIDDIGTEYGNTAEAGLYSIINDRLNTGKPMIISTNLTSEQIQQKYNERIASRLNSFVIVRFIGKDLRSSSAMPL